MSLTELTQCQTYTLLYRNCSNPMKLFLRESVWKDMVLFIYWLNKNNNSIGFFLPFIILSKSNHISLYFLNKIPLISSTYLPYIYPTFLLVTISFPIHYSWISTGLIQFRRGYLSMHIQLFSNDVMKILRMCQLSQFVY